MVNKFKARCIYCGKTVPALGGRLWRVGKVWKCAHLSCSNKKSAQVVEVEFSSGEKMIQNVNGRCIDAPCCGCCT